MPSDQTSNSTRWSMFTDGPELIRDPERRNAFQLMISGTRHSYVDLDDPTYLRYEPSRQIAHMVDAIAEPGAPLRVLHLGAGALMLPRYIAVTRPGSEQQAVDIDTEMLELVQRELPLPPGAQVELRIGDAREELEGAPEGAFDMIVTDAFSGPQVPAHLTSTEYLGLVKRALRPGGVHAVNLRDGSPGGGGLTFSRGQVATARHVFAHVVLLVDPDILRGRRLGNLVVLASDAPLPTGELAKRTASDAFHSEVMEGRDLEDFQGDAEAVTDARIEAA